MKETGKERPLRNIVVIGASAGGVEALKAFFAKLPSGIDAYFFVVLHTPAAGQSILPELISKAGHLVAYHATDHMPFVSGRVYVAPPDHHMILQPGFIRLSRGAKENRHRPAIDPLFRSAALAFGPRTIGIILSGTLDDGTSGLAAIKKQGGIAMVQHPTDALFPGMPLSALAHVEIDHSLPVDLLAKSLITLCALPAPETGPSEAALGIEMKIGEAHSDGDELLNQLGKPSVFTCPECHGALWEITEGDVLRFRCHVGHAFSAESLSAEINNSVESTMWSSVRALEEAANLAKLQEIRSQKRGNADLAANFKIQSERAEGHAAMIRKSLKVAKED